MVRVGANLGSASAVVEEEHGSNEGAKLRASWVSHYTYIHIHIHAYIHTYTYTHMYTRARE